MVSKKLSLGIFMLLISITIIGLGISAEENPIIKYKNGTVTNDGYVGEVVRLYGDDYNDSISYYLKFDNETLSPNPVVSVSDTGNLTTTDITIPAKTTGQYDFEVYNESDIVVASKTFLIKNSDPEITTTSLTAYVGKASIGDIAVSDKNGKELSSCAITPTPTNTMLKNINANKNAALDACTLTFATDKEPVGGDLGDYTFSLKVTDNAGGTDTENISLSVKDYMEINKVTIDDETGDEDDHLPGDTIKVKVRIKNLIDTAALELDKDTLEDIKITVENDDLDIDEDSTKFDLDDKGDEATKTITFQIPYNADEGDYELKITAEGEDDSSDEHYAETTKTLKIEQKSHDLRVTDVSFKEESHSCGGAVTISFNVRNIGTTDEEDITVTVASPRLNLKKVLDDFDLDSNEKKTREVVFELPEKVYDDAYRFNIEAKYDEGGEATSESKDLTIANCKSKFLDLALANTIVNIGDTTNLTFTLENIGLSDDAFKIKIIGVDKFGSFNTSADLNSITIEAEKTKTVDIALYSKAESEEGLYEIKVEIYKGDELVGSKSVGVTLKAVGLLSGMAIFKGDSGQAGLTIAILVVIALIIYLGYQLWFKGKDWSKFGKEKEDKDKPDDDEEISSLIFEEEPKKPARKKKK